MVYRINCHFVLYISSVGDRTIFSFTNIYRITCNFVCIHTQCRGPLQVLKLLWREVKRGGVRTWQNI
jgi:hypothetical protein